MVVIENVEGEESEPLAHAVADILLQSIEIAGAVRPLHDHSPIEHKMLSGDLRGFCGDGTISLSPIMLVAAVDGNVAGAQMQLGAEAIKFDLMHPVGAAWWTPCAGGKAEAEKTRIKRRRA